MPHRLHYRKPLTSLSTYIKFCSRTLAVDDQSEETVPRLKSVWSLVRNALGEPLPAYQELTIAGDRCRSGEDFDSEVEENIDELDENLVRCPSNSKEVDLKHQLPGLLRPPVGDLWDSVEVEEVAKHGTLPTSKDKDQVAHKLTTGSLTPPEKSRALGSSRWLGSSPKRVSDASKGLGILRVFSSGARILPKGQLSLAQRPMGLAYASNNGMWRNLQSASRGSTLYRGSLTPLPSCIPPTPLNHYRPHDYVFRKYLDDQHGIRYAYAARFSRSMKKLEFHKHGDHKWSHNDLSRVDDFINFWASRDLKVSARAGGKKKESGTAWRGTFRFE
ncbi:hypothetical protein, variant [Puccinia striiformis f. sp. tritici PST-78]|uniref:Uncharacterized protein n=1 Tax=Puccinia striiformis f. sp. tritici PST-78 TaxID=1165861 RepID=A0A0L0VK40_9BASI|nr:hypothetical protein, variant [Puccinia striiformis f. sp. tritici PST-78]